MQIGYLLPLSPIAAAPVEAPGGAKPALPTIRVPPSPPIDARLGFLSVAASPCRGSLQSPPRITPPPSISRVRVSVVCSGMGNGRRRVWGGGGEARRGEWGRLEPTGRFKEEEEGQYGPHTQKRALTVGPET